LYEDKEAVMTRIVTLVAFAACLLGAAPPALANRGTDIERVVAGPTAEQLEALAVELADGTMRAFLDGIRKKDLRTLGPIASLRFRRTYTPEQVNEAFKQFFMVSVTGDPLAGRSPVFLAAPKINNAGGLEVQGLYDVGTGALIFQHVYVREGSGWKLDGLNVRSEPYNAPNASAPGADPAKKPLKFKIPDGPLVDA
jgi:hypothetical protein